MSRKNQITEILFCKNDTGIYRNSLTQYQIPCMSEISKNYSIPISNMIGDISFCFYFRN